MEVLLDRASIIQCFGRAKDSVNLDQSNQHDMCVHKAYNLKYDTTEMAAATNEDCIG